MWQTLSYPDCNLTVCAKLNEIAILQCDCCAWQKERSCVRQHASNSCKVRETWHCQNDTILPSASSELPLRRVPLELPLSCSTQFVPSQKISACFSDTALSLIQILLALVLPTVSFSIPGLQNSVSVLGPAVTLSLSSSGTISSSSACHT